MAPSPARSPATAAARRDWRAMALTPKKTFTSRTLTHSEWDWRALGHSHALALTQVHHPSDSCEDGEALSSMHSTALAAGKLIHNLLCAMAVVKND